MDAQNAVEATSTKPSASPKRQSSTVADPQSKASVAKSPTLRKSSPTTTRTSKSSAAASNTHDDDDGTHDGSSEAETIVLPGKDGHSPAKSRKVIKHEDRNGGASLADVPASRKPLLSETNASDKPDRIDKVDKVDKSERGDRGSNKAASGAPGVPSRDQRPSSVDRDRVSGLPGKKRRLHEKPRSKDGSSGLSSAPTSPPHHRRRRLSNAHSDSGSDSRIRSPRSSSTLSKEPTLPGKDKPRSLDKQLAHKRKAPKAETDEEGEARKIRRPKSTGGGGDSAAPGKENKAGKEPSKAHGSKQQHEGRPTSRTRSVSPQPQLRAHRRSVSSQLPPHANGMSHKKKRIPAPLQSTDYPSDDSSANGSPHIRSSKLRSLTTPATTESNMSPAKQAVPHKKHLDPHGQTQLARACARGELDLAKQRLNERPQDLDFPDFAGNTPLQIAAINGCHKIVQMLVDAGCQLDCVNNEKDTPLLDAVENGHLKVVKILLDAGVNPRKANVNGEEPLDRVDEDKDNAEEIRAALIQAKKRMSNRFRASEDRHDPDEGHRSHDPDNPRNSPDTGSLTAAGTLRRGGTVRANKTSNHLLYSSLDVNELRRAAGRGEDNTVMHILEALPQHQKSDSEAMVAAARGGHEMVVQLLLALGGANADAPPVASITPEHATPMLAAIGQENIKIINLLLRQSNFDPTRRFKGETYHEIAKRRQGVNWKEEEHLLKTAYDTYRKTHKDGKTKSPSKKDQDKEVKRAGRLDQKGESSTSNKRKASSPSREAKRPKAPTSPNERRRSNSFSQNVTDQTSPKRGPGRPKKDDRVPSITVSDRESSPAASKQASKTRKVDTDAAHGSSDGETPKPRRKLVSGRDLKKESEKQRRASMASTSTTGPSKEGSSPRDPRHDDVSEKQKSDKTLDRTKQLKRDESRDRLSAGESSGKRSRASATPEKEGVEGTAKKRRLDPDAKDAKERKKQKVNASSDDRPPKASISREPSSSKSNHKDRDDEGLKPVKPKRRDTSSDRVRRESGKSASSEKSIHVRSEEPDTDMPDATEPVKEQAETDARLVRDRDEGKKHHEDAKRVEVEEKERKRKLAEDEAKRKELEDKKAREEEEKKRQEEEEKRKQEEEEKKRREEEEQARRDAEDKKRREEEEARQKREEAETRRREAEAEAARKLEEEQRKEEERKEHERKEQERKERLQREEERRRAAREAERAAKEAEQRRILQEKEQLRLAKLPYLLRWLDQCANPKTPDIANLFRQLEGVRASCLRPELEGTAEGKELWVMNSHVALLLGEKDLNLSRFTAWERIPATRIAKKLILYRSCNIYNMTALKVQPLAKQMGWSEIDLDKMSPEDKYRTPHEHNDKFLALDLFFVKLSDFMFMVPSFPHLRNVKMIVDYFELSLDENKIFQWPGMWKNDPDKAQWLGWAPPGQYYVNGQPQGYHNPPKKALTSSTPFPYNPGPRRGLLRVAEDDPEWDRLCIEQGLHHRVKGASRPTSSDSGLNGVTATLNGSTAGVSPSTSDPPLVNGDHGRQDVLTGGEEVDVPLQQAGD